MADFTYLDCNLAILDEERTVYYDTFRSETPVEGRIRDDQNGDSLVRDTIERLHARVASDASDITREDLQLLGRHLYYLLFDEGIRQAFEQTYRGFKKVSDGNRRLRLVLAFNKTATKLASYPWEFLFMPSRGNEPGFFLCAEKRTELILTRFVPESSLELFPEETKLKILVAFANPKQLGGRLEADKFVGQITSMTRQIEVRGITEAEKLTKDGLTNEIDAFQPHIFHFVGHGDATKGIALMKTPAEIQDLYDRTGEIRDVEWVDSRALGAIFGEHVPRLVFLHACEGAAADSLGGFNSTARDLVYSYGVPAVIAMQYVISNETAGLFAQTFYQQIADGKPIDIAVSEGRWALRRSLRGDGEFADRGFGTPLVYLQSESAIVLHQADEDSGDGDGDGRRREPCPYRDGCRGSVLPGDKACGPCGRPLAVCEEGHAMAADAEFCPQGHRAAQDVRAATSSPAQAHESRIESGRGGVAPEPLVQPVPVSATRGEGRLGAISTKKED